MRLLLFLLLLASGCWHSAIAQAPSPQAPAVPATTSAPTARQLKLAEDLLNTVYTEESFNQLIEQAVVSRLSTQPSLKPYEELLRSYMRKYMGWAAMRPQMAAIYAREFTESELLDITHYYQSPTGRKAAAKMPALMRGGMEIGQRAMQEHMPELTEAIQAKLEADKH